MWGGGEGEGVLADREPRENNLAIGFDGCRGRSIRNIVILADPLLRQKLLPERIGDLLQGVE